MELSHPKPSQIGGQTDPHSIGGNLENKFLRRKVRQPLKRKPLYPSSKNKESAKSTVTIKGNFVRAARLDNNEEAAALPSDNYSPERSRTVSPNDPEEDYYSDEEYYSESDEDSESYRRSPSASPTSRRSPSVSRRSFDASPSRSPTLAPSTTATAAPTASYMSRHSLGSDGSSQRSETPASPTSPKSTLKSPVRNDSAASNQTYSKSLGHSILSRARRSLKSGRTEDLIDHDEDAKNYSHRTLRYGNSFSTKTDERNHDVTVTSHGNGTENNDVESRLNSGGSLFSYKTNSPDVRRPKSKYVCNCIKRTVFYSIVLQAHRSGLRYGRQWPL